MQAYCAELSHFDYHKVIKSSSSNIESTLTQSLLPDIVDFRKRHGFYVCNGSQVSKQQTATIRTNCLDCLDRTNSVQSFFGLQVKLSVLVSHVRKVAPGIFKSSSVC